MLGRMPKTVMKRRPETESMDSEERIVGERFGR
jgi:hypothetical protein